MIILCYKNAFNFKVFYQLSWYVIQFQIAEYSILLVKIYYYKIISCMMFILWMGFFSVCTFIYILKTIPGVPEITLHDFKIT